MLGACLSALRRVRVTQGSPLLRVLLVAGVFTYGSHSVLTNLSKGDDGRVAYNVASVVLMTELCKLLISCTLALLTLGTRGVVGEVRAGAFKPRFFLLLSVPALLYALNNNTAYYAQQAMDPVSFMVLCNFKIITTAILFRLIMNRSLSRNQWLAMPILLFSSILNSMAGLAKHSSIVDESAQDTNILLKSALYVSPYGLMLMVMYCTISGFAGVYAEYVLKSRMHASLHMQNIPLYLCGVVMNATAYFWSSSSTNAVIDDTALRLSHSATSLVWMLGPFARLFDGYNGWTWVIILTQAGNGLILSVVMKHSTNIVKLFMIALSMLLSTATSILAFDMSLSWEFVLALVLVLWAIALYHTPAPASSAATMSTGPARPVAHGAAAAFGESDQQRSLLPFVHKQGYSGMLKQV
ncbi:hypothetical protein CAOG_01543 [Capsaspora owczarzaki ATCC 30864]|uniref:Uncharacterized protein n=1 Tax=Capsaspora owczarzaki (strain ATCC 30864) TaxID=595528 RepID=A0A0D2U4X2_CAPO3|nr:hypothetical protein CAOG_01543 [Capsaspora owczarzaki ATCC 30864]KJE90201.1 hypothetical protein CAOG_001543 [Capsaspora owczarzaki ATCC 30864]|eukprot:XP_004364411.1 hypothetical protein CAOG_01543 [Capsaspora owczarzaki ATCC 30864]